MVNAGVKGFKCFLVHSGVDEFPCVAENDVRLAMQQMQGTDAVFLVCIISLEQGSHSGESTCPPPIWPGFDSRTWCSMWVEFVVGPHPHSERFFSGFSSFPHSSKICISKFQFDLESEGQRFVCHNRLLSVTLIKQSSKLYAGCLSHEPSLMALAPTSLL